MQTAQELNVKPRRKKNKTKKHKLQSQLCAFSVYRVCVCRAHVSSTATLWPLFSPIWRLQSFSALSLARSLARLNESTLIVFFSLRSFALLLFSFLLYSHFNFLSNVYARCSAAQHSTVHKHIKFRRTFWYFIRDFYDFFSLSCCKSRERDWSGTILRCVCVWLINPKITDFFFLLPDSLQWIVYMAKSRCA